MNYNTSDKSKEQILLSIVIALIANARNHRTYNQIPNILHPEIVIQVTVYSSASATR